MGVQCVVFHSQYSPMFLKKAFMCLKIKYLRVPDPLLDIVKEEQKAARELGRSVRGGPGGNRGSWIHITLAVINAVI